MRKLRFTGIVALVAVCTIVAAACNKTTTPGSGASGASGGGSAGGNDLLAQVMASGKLRVSTDPQYPPQSFLDDKTNTWQGFDIDVATEIAKRMGLTVEWETPDWTVITSGHWNGRWDVSVGSMTITPERAQVLDFTPPYYFTPAGFAVNEANTSITGPADLTGKKVGVCGGCTYEEYLNGTLKIPDYNINFAIHGADLVTYKTDKPAIDDLSLGDCVRLCAAFSAIPTLQAAIDAGKPIKIVGGPLYFEPLAVAVDKSAPADPTSLVQKLSDIIQQMHDDGTLTRFSMKWYGTDLTVANQGSASPSA